MLGMARSASTSSPARSTWPELALESEPFRFGPGELPAHFLQPILDQPAPAAARARTGALLAAGGGGAAAELEGVRRLRFVFGHGRLALLQIRFQPFLFLEEITEGVLGGGSAAGHRAADVFAADRLDQALGHGGVRVRDINVDQAGAATDHRLDHAGKSAGERVLDGGKGRLALRGCGRFCGGGRRCGRFFVGVTKEGAALVRGEPFRADDPGEHGTVGEILFNGAERFLAGEEHGADPPGGVAGIGGIDALLRDIDFERDVALINLRGTGEMSEREKKTGERCRG